MKCTSAEANKLLKQLNEEKSLIIRKEKNAMTFVAATVEDAEKIRPKYSFAETSTKIDELDGKIRKVRHAINVFNTTTIVPGFDVTVDEMLVLLPQMKERLDKLGEMSVGPAVERLGGYDSRDNFIEYRYANYDIQEAEDEYMRLFKLRQSMQSALDFANSSIKFEINI